MFKMIRGTNRSERRLHLLRAWFGVNRHDADFKKRKSVEIKPQVGWAEAEKLKLGIARLCCGDVSALCLALRSEQPRTRFSCVPTLSLAVGTLAPTALCHFLLVPNLRRINAFDAASQPSVSCLFLSLHLELLMPPISCSRVTRSWCQRGRNPIIKH